MTKRKNAHPKQQKKKRSPKTTKEKALAPG
jgi:hypothetical protein